MQHWNAKHDSVTCLTQGYPTGSSSVQIGDVTLVDPRPLEVGQLQS